MGRPAQDQEAAVVIGASGGIGSAVVQHLLRRGIAVLGIDRQEALVRDAGYQHIVMDCGRGGSCDAVLESAPRYRWRYVLNFSGGALPEEVEASRPLELPEATVARTFDDNVGTSINALRIAQDMVALEPDAPAARSVTLCSSINAVGDFNYPLYSMSKAAIEALVVTSARANGRSGIRVNAVRPGTIVTDASERLHGGVDGDHYRRLADVAALGRFVTVDEVAIAAVSLAVDFTGVTGAVLTIDAGQSIAGPS